MEFSEVLNIALPAVYVLVGIVLVWLVVELIFAVRKMSKAISDIQAQAKPALENIERIIASLESAASKIDPLVERVSLTVDAANLELMRVDSILENVGDVTESVSSAVGAIDTVTNVPVELITSVTDRVRKTFKARRTGNESIKSSQTKERQNSADEDKEQQRVLPKRPDSSGAARTIEVLRNEKADVILDKNEQDF